MRKIAFAAMRMQGFHNGHFRLISEMLRDNDLVIIGLGSTQIERTMGNPYTPNERIEMINKVFGKTSKIKIVHLKDIGAVEKHEWVDYCMRKISEKNLNQPNRYYGGCATDVSWFMNAKNNLGGDIETIIIDRYNGGFMSATEVRKSIANNIIAPAVVDNEWKRFVPECLHDFLVEKFPYDLTLEFNLNKDS